MEVDPKQLLVQIASYNTNLQGLLGLPQDLVDWLSPTLQISTFLSPIHRAPDIIAVGFQELLPLHLGPVIDNRNELILSQIEAHAPNKEKYSLIAKVVNVGTALLIYGLDGGIARNICEVETQWTGSGPLYMGNKGAVGVRFRVADDATNHAGEIFTFVCAHLAPHIHRNKQRIQDYQHIAETLSFRPVDQSSAIPTTIFSTTHLFYFGDLNFRLEIPPSHSLSSLCCSPDFGVAMTEESVREELKEFDQLLNAARNKDAFVGLHEGRFWGFKCSYKYELGEVDKYSRKRMASWTDRILYATANDPPDLPYEQSSITNILYTSIPSYTASDHKPIISLLLVPEAPRSSSIAHRLIAIPSGCQHQVNRFSTFKRWSGRTLDRVIGICWWLLTLLGIGSTTIGVVNLALGIGVWRWWRTKA